MFAKKRFGRAVKDDDLQGTETRDGREHQNKPLRVWLVELLGKENDPGRRKGKNNKCMSARSKL